MLTCSDCLRRHQENITVTYGNHASLQDIRDAVNPRRGFVHSEAFTSYQAWDYLYMGIPIPRKMIVIWKQGPGPIIHTHPRFPQQQQNGQVSSKQYYEWENSEKETLLHIKV